MSYSLVRMKIMDYNQWRPVFERFNDLRAEYGCTNQRVFLSPDNPGEVIVLLQWADAERGKGFFMLPAIREGMQEAGVQGPPMIDHLDEMP